MPSRALLFTAGCPCGQVNSTTFGDGPLAQAAEDEVVPAFDYRLEADRLAEVLGAAYSAIGLVAEPLRRLTGDGGAGTGCRGLPRAGSPRGGDGVDAVNQLSASGADRPPALDGASNAPIRFAAAPWAADSWRM